MGSGLSVTEGARCYQNADGTRPLDRSGLSLETVEAWGVGDVVRALEAVSPQYSATLEPHVRKFDVDGPLLLSITSAKLEELLTAQMKLKDEECAAWVSRSVMRLQKRHTIVGRDRRLGPLPKGWQQVASRSRPGSLSYLNTVTGCRTTVRPTDEAAGIEPLPKGWMKMASSRWPGQSIYMHPARPALHLGWRPKPLEYEDPDHVDDKIESLRRALERVRQPDEAPIPALLPRQLLSKHAAAKAKFRAVSRIILSGVHLKSEREKD